jgi:hypothetical protein
VSAVADGVRVRWDERPAPLAPAAVVAEGPTVAAALLRRVLDASDADLAGWAGVFAPGSATVALTAVGPQATPLPWADGVRYLGRDSDEGAPPGLLLPTALRPSVPAALLHRSVRLSRPAIEEPFAVWPIREGQGGDGLRILPLHRARPLDRATVVAAYNRLTARTTSP